MGGWCQSFGALIVSRALMSSGFTAINAGDLCTMGLTWKMFRGQRVTGSWDGCKERRETGCLCGIGMGMHFGS